MKASYLLFLIIFILNGCSLRVGLDPSTRISTGNYPPAVKNKVVKIFCIPCVQFQGWGVGLMFTGGWPTVFYTE